MVVAAVVRGKSAATALFYCWSEGTTAVDEAELDDPGPTNNFLVWGHNTLKVTA